jgi:PKD repeat protein
MWIDRVLLVLVSLTLLVSAGSIHGSVFPGSSTSDESLALYASAAPLVAWANVTPHACPPCGAEPWHMQGTATVTGGVPPYTETWNPGAGQPPASGSNVTFTLPYTGNYFTVLLATDQEGARATSLVQESLFGGFPYVTALATSVAGPTPLTIDFRETGSSSLTAGNFSWQFGDGTSAVGPAVEHTFERAGSYLTVLNETNSGQTNATFAFTIDAIAPNSPPIVFANATSPATCGGPVTDDFHAAVVGGKSPYSYLWTFGDGGSGSSLANPTHTYPGEGFTAEVIVTDANGQTATTRVSEVIDYATGCQTGTSYFFLIPTLTLVVAAAVAVSVYWISGTIRRSRRGTPPQNPPQSPQNL